MVKNPLDAAARRLNPILVLIALGLGVVDVSLEFARMTPPASPRVRQAVQTPPASAVMSSEVSATISDMKDRD